MADTSRLHLAQIRADLGTRRGRVQMDRPLDPRHRPGLGCSGRCDHHADCRPPRSRLQFIPDRPGDTCRCAPPSPGRSHRHGPVAHSQTLGTWSRVVDPRHYCRLDHRLCYRSHIRVCHRSDACHASGHSWPVICPWPRSRPRCRRRDGGRLPGRETTSLAGKRGDIPLDASEYNGRLCRRHHLTVRYCGRGCGYQSAE